MKILVTGGAGYLGSVLVEELLRTDRLSIDKVVVLDNFMYGQTSLSHLCWDDVLEIVRGDARRITRDFVSEFDVVIPLAAIVGAPACDANITAAISTNADAIEALVCNMNLDQRLIIPISNSGYGVGEKGVLLTEKAPLNPVSLYGKNKVFAETAAMEHGNTISLRLATVFGMSPRMRMDLLVNDFVWRAVHDKAVVLFEADFRRNYIHIRDVARTVIHSLFYWQEMKNNIYNVGLSSANLSKRQLCQEIKKQVEGFVFVEAEVGEDPDKRDYVVSNAKLEATGWSPRWSLSAGIAELVKGYRMFRKVQYGNI